MSKVGFQWVSTVTSEQTDPRKAHQTIIFSCKGIQWVYSTDGFGNFPRTRNQVSLVNNRRYIEPNHSAGR